MGMYLISKIRFHYVIVLLLNYMRQEIITLKGISYSSYISIFPNPL